MRLFLILLGIVVYLFISGCVNTILSRIADYDEFDIEFFSWTWPVGLIVAILYIPVFSAKIFTNWILNYINHAHKRY